MRIEQFHVVINEDELNAIVRRYVPDLPIKNMEIHCNDGEIAVEGRYFVIPFKALIHVHSQGSTLKLELYRLDVFGFSGQLGKRKLIGHVAERISGTRGIDGDNDGVTIDLREFIAARGYDFSPDEMKIDVESGEVRLNVVGNIEVIQ